MGCTACLEQSLRASQQALTKARAMVLALQTVLKDVKPLLPPEQQRLIDEVLGARVP